MPAGKWGWDESVRGRRVELIPMSWLASRLPRRIRLWWAVRRGRAPVLREDFEGHDAPADRPF